MEECRLEYDDVGGLTQQSVSALVAYVSSSSPASPSEPSESPEPSEAGTSSDSHGHALAAPQLIPPDQAARAWIRHLKRGGEMPERDNLVGLLEALAVSYQPRPMLVPVASRADEPGIQLVVEDTSQRNKFPHMIDTAHGTLTDEEAIWTQCKTKMTHFCVKLKDANGQPVKGAAVQPGGLELRLTLHRVSDPADPMHEGHNPRSHEGLLIGRADAEFIPEALLTESRHEFRFRVLLLSSDIGGSRMFVKVAPVDPQLALNPKLVVQSRSFISRARMPDETDANREARERQAATTRLDNREQRTDAAATHLLCMAHHPHVETRAESPPHKRRCSPEPREQPEQPEPPPPDLPPPSEPPPQP